MDAADVTTPTYFNYEASLDGFRDSDTTATSVYNKFYDLFKTVDTEYYLIKRVGKTHDANVAAGDLISIFGVKTDYPVDIFADGEMIRMGARFLTTGKVKLNYTVPAGTAGAFGELRSTIGTKSTSNGKIKVLWTPVANGSDSASTGGFLSAAPSLANGVNILGDSTKTYDLTEAIAWDSFELGNQDSNKIEDRSLLDEGQVQTRGFAQLSAGLNFFRTPYKTVADVIVSATAVSTATTFQITGDKTSSIEVGMSARIADTNGTIKVTPKKVIKVVLNGGNTDVTVDAALGSALVTTDKASFYNAQTLAWDLFNQPTGSTRPTGYLTIRVNKAASNAIAANDVVSIYKFTADAVMENTEGEDSIKFMVNFASQGKLSKNAVLGAA